MKILRTLSACAVAAFFPFTLRAQVTSFQDDFEGPTLDSFWTVQATSGSITFPSTGTVHGGTQAVRLDSVQTSAHKYIALRHAFPYPVHGRVSVWMYDNAAGVLSSNYFGMSAGSISIGVFDYDLGPTNGGSYVYNVSGSAVHSNITRSLGWHEFSIAAYPTSLTLSVDGITIYSGPGGRTLTDVVLSLGGPNWRPAWTTSFDDFSFTTASAFQDGFERPTLDSFWTVQSTSGSVTFPSTGTVHGGIQAVRLDSTQTSAHKYVALRHVFPYPTHGRVSVWVYDNAAGVLSSNYFGMTAGGISIGVFDYDLGPTNGGSYVYNVSGSAIHSNISRSIGWHEFSIAAQATSLSLSVDGITIYSGPGGQTLTDVVLSLSGPNWRPAWTTWFDDFTFAPPVPPSYTLFGSGCAGSSGTPTLQATTVPRIGSSFDVAVTSLPISSAVFGVLGVSNTQMRGAIPLPLDLDFVGMPGCALHVSDEIILFVGQRPTPTTASWSLPLPHDVHLLGFEFFQQVLVTDPGVNTLGVIASNAARARIGN